MGERMRRVEMVSFGEEEERPKRVPRRVKRCCEGETLAARSEYGEPRISKEASDGVSRAKGSLMELTYPERKPSLICH